MLADASWSNPARLVYLQDDQVFSGFQAVIPNMEFDISVATGGGGDGNAGILTEAPSFFYVHKYSDRVGFELFLAGTMGGGVDYGNNFAGRYSTTSAELGALGLSPSVAYTLNESLSVGADSIDIDWKNPQWLEIGLRYDYTDRGTLYFNAGWQDCSVFSNNQLAFSGGVLNPVAELERNWKDTWHAGIAYSHRTGRGSIYSLGFSYDSSPVDDDDRTFDLPVDEIFKYSAAYAWEGQKNLDFSVGGTLYLVGDAAIDDMSQGVRTKGELDSNAILFLGGTLALCILTAEKSRHSTARWQHNADMSF